MLNYMKFFIILLVFKSSIAQTEAIRSVLDNWHVAASEADFQTYFNLMSSDAVFVGSDATEVWPYEEFKAFSKPYFDAGKAWTFSPVNRHIYMSADKNLAWFDEVLTSEHMGLCRGSGVLVRNKTGDWKINHYVLSLAVPNSLVDSLVQQKAVLDADYLESHSH